MLQLEPGTVFARDFRIVRALARGGMGAVYEVEQLSTSKTRALKVLHAQLAGDPKIRQRFEQEARIGGRIESDHIVDVVAAGIEDPGTPWLVMEFLKGHDLGAHLDRNGPRPPAEVDEIFRQMGHALAAAHRAGLVHRDLKPENIFLAESRREGAPFTVKVLDFGIAKALETAPERATQAMGTPYWMAPEQCADSKLISPATDVWALGLIAYSLLTGACYWRAAALTDGAVAALLIEMTSAPLEPASVRARSYGRDTLLPPGFDAWFARCVCREIDQRFRDAAECVAALTPVLTQASSPTIPTPPPAAPLPVTAQGAPTALLGGPAPAQPAMEGAPMQSAPMQSAPMQSAPMQSAPMQSAPMQSAPMQSAPMQPMAMQPMAMQPMPVAPMGGPAMPSTPRTPWLLIIVIVGSFAALIGAFTAWRQLRPRHGGVADVPHAEPQPDMGSPVMQPMPPPVIVAQPTGMQPVPPSVVPMPTLDQPPRPAAIEQRTGYVVQLAGVDPDHTSASTMESARRIRLALAMFTSRVGVCVRAAAAETRSDPGNAFVVLLSIGATGDLQSTTVLDLDSTTLDRCIDRTFKSRTYGANNVGGYRLTYTVSRR